jgi:hypothetical protein
MHKINWLRPRSRPARYLYLTQLRKTSSTRGWGRRYGLATGPTGRFPGRRNPGHRPRHFCRPADSRDHDRGQTFVMPEEGGGASLFPQVGAEVTVFYEEQGGKNVITRIGQAQQ